MRKQLVSVALLAVLATMTASCQKEKLDEPQQSVTTENSTVRSVCYSVDGVRHHVVLQNDDEWMLFMDSLIGLTTKGHRVTVFDEETSSNSLAAKETVTYVTKDREAATKWAAKKVEEGYDVTVTFNEDTGEFTCVAVR